MLDNFTEPAFKILLRFTICQVMHQDKALIVVVKNVPGVSVTVRATDVTQFYRKKSTIWSHFLPNN